jgi:hypothetical protein
LPGSNCKLRRKLDVGKFYRGVRTGPRLRLVRCILELFRLVGEPNVFVALATSDDAIVEGHASGAAAQLAYFEAVGGFVGDVQTFAVPLWRQKT